MKHLTEILLVCMICSIGYRCITFAKAWDTAASRQEEVTLSSEENTAVEKMLNGFIYFDDMETEADQEFTVKRITLDDFIVENADPDRTPYYEELEECRFNVYTCYRMFWKGAAAIWFLDNYPFLTEKEREEITYPVTYRGITQGSTVEDVIDRYGRALRYPFSKDTDAYYLELRKNSEDAVVIEETAKSYIVYSFEDIGQIVFYFDADEHVYAAMYSTAEHMDGMEKDENVVKLVQEALNALGYDAGTVDGVAGSATRKAIQAYIDDSGEDLNGFIDVDLIASLGLEDDMQALQRTIM